MRWLWGSIYVGRGLGLAARGVGDGLASTSDCGHTTSADDSGLLDCGVRRRERELWVPAGRFSADRDRLSLTVYI